MKEKVKKNLREFIVSIYILQEALKEVLHAEMKGH